MRCSNTKMHSDSNTANCEGSHACLLKVTCHKVTASQGSCQCRDWVNIVDVVWHTGCDGQSLSYHHPCCCFTVSSQHAAPSMQRWHTLRNP
jgi:hypothetical protein